MEPLRPRNSDEHSPASSMLGEIGFAAAGFLQSSRWEDLLPEVLSRIGSALEVSRAHFWELRRDAHGELFMSLIHRWDNPCERRPPGGATAVMVPSDVRPSLEAAGWSLEQRVICLCRSETSGSLFEILDRLEVASLLCAVLLIGGRPQWILGFSECERERIWSRQERQAAQVIADILAAAIQRSADERELRIANATLEEMALWAKEKTAEAVLASSAKSSFLASMSHEIRTPMSGVLGMLDLLRATELSEEQREYVEVARGSGGVLLGLINDILDFSKIEADKMELDSTDFDLIQVVEESAELLGERACEKGIELITCVSGPPLPVLRGDPLRLRQVLINLVGNAVKFTTRGEVAVKVDPVELSAERALLRFSVRDTGIGIPAETCKRLFQEYAQADPAMARRFGGTGLGLAISSRLVRAMGGTMKVESEPGVGSTFSFSVSFPLSAPTTLTEEIPALRGRSLRILNDSAAAGEFLRSSTAAWGITAEVSDDASGALSALRTEAAEGRRCLALLVDERLPGLDPRAFAAEIRRDPLLRDLPLILLGPFGSAPPPRALQEGWSALLGKPMTRQRLQRVLLHLAVPAAGGVGPLGGPRPARPAGSGSVPTTAATAFVPVPVAEPSAPPDRAREDSLPRILLVEDNLVNQKVALRMVEKLGFQVEIASDGRQAVAAALRGNHDLILMDCQMPEMDGFEATRQIRAGEAPGQRVPIVALTANAWGEIREQCDKAGMDDFLSKPIDPAVLRQVLNRWIAPEGAARAEAA